MTTLPQMLSNLRGLGSLMIEQVAQIEEIMQFFNGATGATVPPVPYSAYIPQPVTPTAPPPPPPPPEPPGDAPVDKPKRKYKMRSRPITAIEKAAIRQDWNNFLPHQRTAINRLALAAKYKVSGQHVFSLVRPNPPLNAYHKDLASRGLTHHPKHGIMPSKQSL